MDNVKCFNYSFLSNVWNFTHQNQLLCSMECSLCFWWYNIKKNKKNNRNSKLLHLEVTVVSKWLTISIEMIINIK